jgi:hypothetical protein
MLPAPELAGVKDGATIDLTVDSESPAVKLDDLGPMVVNSDGVCLLVPFFYDCQRTLRVIMISNWNMIHQTLSRIANWESMTGPERERTMRVLNARNKWVLDLWAAILFQTLTRYGIRVRLAKEEEKLRGQENTLAAKSEA